MPFDDFLHRIGIDVTTTTAGVIGGLLSIAFVEKSGLIGRATAVTGGWACAHFLTPHVKTYFDVAGPGGGIAFLLGLFGMLIVSALANVIKTINLAELISGWVKKWTGQ